MSKVSILPAKSSAVRWLGMDAALLSTSARSTGSSHPIRGYTNIAVRAARRERLEVTLFPIVRLARAAPGEWRGTLTPASRERWFRSYGEVLGDLAAIGAQTGVTRLVVGSELSTLDSDLARWRPLLERVRALFRGRLVYSANWDHYQDARLFDLVDEEGVVAYFNLRDGPQAPATEAALQAAWRRHRDALAAWHGADAILGVTEWDTIARRRTAAP